MKNLILKAIDSECIINVSHKLNKDGYFRKCINGKNEMYHRHVWERVNGTIPEGYEIDHKCKNRACCNIEHLQLLSSSEHRTKDNTGRNSQRKLSAKVAWYQDKNISGTRLAEIFGVSFGIGCRWIREWKEDLNENN